MFRIKMRLSNKTNVKSEATLMFDINYEKERFYLSSGITIPTDLWNHTKQTIRKKEGYNANLLNVQLGQRKSDIEGAVEQLLKLQLPVNKKNILLYAENTGESTKSQTFRTYINEFISEKKNSWAESTLEKYQYLFNSLDKFTEKYKYPISFKTLNSKFFSKFEEYFLKDKGVYNNGFGGYIKNLKAFLYWAKGKGYHHFTDFEGFEVYKEEPDIFPLTPEEIAVFEKYSFDGLKEDVRSVFLFQIYTGLRISDTQLLSTPHYDKKGQRIINFRTKKTGTPLVIPLIPKAIAILDKYKHLHSKNRLLPNINNQVANRYLKELADLLGLTHEIIYYRKKGREYIPFNARRCDMISTHDARRTFITYCLSKGMGAHMIMRITGHSSFKTFERYVKINEKDITQQLNFVWQ